MSLGTRHFFASTPLDRQMPPHSPDVFAAPSSRISPEEKVGAIAPKGTPQSLHVVIPPTIPFHSPYPEAGKPSGYLPNSHRLPHPQSPFARINSLSSSAA